MAASLLADCLRPGDRLLIGQALAEPVGLVADLFDCAPRMGLSVFGGYSLNPAWRGEVPHALALSTYCGMGTWSALVASGRARLVPASLLQLSSALSSRKLAIDVVLLQVSPADDEGFHSLGCTQDHVWDAVAVARAVVVEVNHRLPVTRGAARLHRSQVVIARECDEPLLEAPAEPVSPVQQAIARQVASLVPDGATLQLGIGGLAVAVACAVRDRRGLKLRSGMVGDWFMDLLDSGAIDTDTPDACLASLAVGSPRLYGALSVGAPLGFAPPSRLVVPVPGSPLMAINSAVEVDLAGHANAEFLGERYVGAVGGQTEYLRAARRSEGGLAILALPSRTGGGQRSRIVARCAWVTSAQSDVDVIATEQGLADIRCTTLAERCAAIAAIADPRDRPGLLAQSWPSEGTAP